MSIVKNIQIVQETLKQKVKVPQPPSSSKPSATSQRKTLLKVSVFISCGNLFLLQFLKTQLYLDFLGLLLDGISWLPFTED